MTKSEMASSIDHTNLKPEATSQDITQLCKEAIEQKFAAVCVQPCFVPLCTQMLKGTQVKVCTVVGFPLGVNSTDIKVAETELAVSQGAQEIDMVINVGKVKEGDEAYLKIEIARIREACPLGVSLKVILELSALNDSEKQRCAQMALEAGADYLKTSTGTHKLGGATLLDAAMLMKTVTGSKVKVKAAGGIRDLKTFQEYLNLGVHRIGTSSGISIIKEYINEAN